MIKNVNKSKCEGIEILKHINDISFTLKLNSQQNYLNLVRDKLDKMKKSEFYDIIFLLQNILHEENINYEEDEVLYFLYEVFLTEKELPPHHQQNEIFYFEY